jgi:hypothetical protein
MCYNLGGVGVDLSESEPASGWAWGRTRGEEVGAASLPFTCTLKKQ